MRSIVPLPAEALNAYRMGNASKAGPCDFLGLPAYAAENERLRMIVVPAWGSRVISLEWKPSMTELLRKPDSVDSYKKEPMLHGIPVLFPPNRIDGGRFRFEGTDYHFTVNEPETGCHSHGLVHDKAWKLRGLGADGDLAWIETEFDSVESAETLAQLPQRFVIVLRMEIEGDEFRQFAFVSNRGARPFPMGLGYHTSFRLPFGDGGLESCIIKATVGERWELDDRFLPTGRLLDEAGSRSLRDGLCLEGVLLDDVFLVDTREGNAVTMTDREAGISIVYRAGPEFKHWVLHNGNGSGGYFCPEPYTCVTNGFNLGLCDEGTGVLRMEPGQTSRFSCSIKIVAITPNLK